MAKKQSGQPPVEAPITAKSPVSGQIKIFVTGNVTVKSSDPKIKIERRD